MIMLVPTSLLRIFLPVSYRIGARWSITKMYNSVWGILVRLYACSFWDALQKLCSFGPPRKAMTS